LSSKWLFGKVRSATNALSGDNQSIAPLTRSTEAERSREILPLAARATSPIHRRTIYSKDVAPLTSADIRTLTAAKIRIQRPCARLTRIKLVRAF
jgi:hypothetical protein